jgi:hypothetical protein
MSVPKAVVVPPEIAEYIDNLFADMVKVGAQLAMSRDGIRYGIALRQVFKKDTMEAQAMCLATGVLVAQGWLSMVEVQGRIKGFIRKYPKAGTPALNDGLLRFPRGECERETARATPAVVVELMQS